MGKTVVAITGVNSYFASTVLPRLQDDPKVERIIGIDTAPWKGGYDKVDFFREDVRSENIVDILRDVDTLYHLAFVVGEIRDKEKTRDINSNGSRNVFEACAQNRVKKIIYTSSMTVYGARRHTPLGLDEDAPLARHEDSYYSTSKVEMEQFVAAFSEEHPEITCTVLRAALLCGPGINNMFSRLWSMRIGALPLGRVPQNQLIHEEDLGEALYLALEKDLPGVYNVAADDAVSTGWCFREAGVKVVPLPAFLLRPVADLAFRLGLFPAGGGWASIGEYTIFGRSDRFKAAAGWRPRYTSEETFRAFLEARERPANKRLTESLVAFLLQYQAAVKAFLGITDTGFKLGKVPGLRRVFPWTDPRKNSITYLPVGEHVEYKEEEILPQTVHNLIDKASVHVILDRCACRYGEKCENHPIEIGCMFMGESALSMPETVRRRVTREKAHAHVDRAISAGLVPMTGKVRYDNDAFLIPDRKKLLAVCFCCHCCCMMRSYKYLPADQLNEVMPRAEGFHLEISDACTGCGTCVEYCGWDAIQVENGKAVHSETCRGCGRCAVHCPEQAVHITIQNPQAVADVEKRLLGYVDIE
jgi:UDP-glucose 4-epimerase